MKRAQFLGVAIAGVCGVAAFFGVMSLVNKPAKVVKEEVTTNTTQVLVAKTEVPLGAITGPENFRWQDWPQSALGAGYIQRTRRQRGRDEQDFRCDLSQCSCAGHRSADRSARW